MAEEPIESKEENNSPEDYKSKYLYLLAEMDNYRKIRDKERDQYSKFSNEVLMTALLKVLDDFDSVLKAGEEEKVKLMQNSLMSTLSSFGLKRLQVVGTKFSPDIAESVSTEEVEEDKKGLILEEIQAGYELNGKVIRYPKVKVGI
ncbi:nucleotide exchange factor GrpE [Candidatus Parvarchaeota archaeon]|uniref:Nucleotide exchange factor GrpE n=1 Tax=Candidatus Acidifodinimicrobium mancum TaxID=2898728 RepID=A0A8T3URL3_9ARCH|nr:nucleotide exchange factor GrpE [Candidatus Acidifodinimicrobium mancum]MBE5729282.1 nucleotide exchange factor GrpE [Candidatus Acidifodinimicrobium mancum]